MIIYPGLSSLQTCLQCLHAPHCETFINTEQPFTLSVIAFSVALDPAVSILADSKMENKDSVASFALLSWIFGSKCCLGTLELHFFFVFIPQLGGWPIQEHQNWLPTAHSETPHPVCIKDQIVGFLSLTIFLSTQPSRCPGHPIQHSMRWISFYTGRINWMQTIVHSLYSLLLLHLCISLYMLGF